MVARDVRERRDEEAHVVDAVERERVRAHLHRDGARAGVAHLREHGVELGRQRRRVLESPRAVGELGADRSDDAARMPAAPRIAAIMCATVVFPFVPVTPTTCEIVRGIAVKRRRQSRERAPRVANAHDGYARRERGARDALYDDRASPRATASPT